METHALDGAETHQLTEALRRMDLLEQDECPPLISLTGGVSSRIALARTARGPVCVKQALPKLRVASDWFAPVERNRAEVAWMKIAATVVPQAVPSILGEDTDAMAFAMEWMDPAHYRVWKEQLRDGFVDARTARQVGERLVAIHSATAGDGRIAAQFAHNDVFHAIRLEPYLEAAARAQPLVADELQRLVTVTASTKRALVHGDISPKNILVGPTGPVFLDAECAWYGDPAFDLAFCLNHLLLKSVWRPTSQGQLLAAFDALASAYLAGVDWEEPGELERRAANLLPGLLLARVDGKSPVEYLTESADRTRVRQFAFEHLRKPVSQLSSIRTRWGRQGLQ